MGRVFSGKNNDEFKKWEPKEFSANFVSSINQQKSTYQQEEVEQLISEAKVYAYQQGFEEGLKQTQSEINQQMQQQWQSKIGHLQQLTESLHEPFSVIDDQLEQHIVKLVMSIATVLYRREVKMNPEQLLAVVKEAKALLPSNQSNVRIHLNPDDSKILQNFSFELKDDSLCQLFVEDETLKPGDCRVISDETQVDATLEARLTSIIDQVFSHE